MKAARIHAYGALDDIRIEDVPEPVPGLDEVLIRVEAAALNPMDNKLLAGYLKDFFLSPSPIRSGPISPERWLQQARSSPPSGRVTG